MILENIAKAIEKSGKSRYQISKETGIDQAVLCRIMQGGSCSIETADQLLEYLGLKLRHQSQYRDTTEEIRKEKLADELHKFRWGQDKLSATIEAASYNIGISFLYLRPYWECLIKVGEIFDDANKLLSHFDETSLILRSLFAKSYGCFLGAVRLSCSGQISETYLLLRACIENSLYAFYIFHNPSYSTIWMNRDISEDDRKKCKKLFTVRKIFDALETNSKTIKKEVENCYDKTIDWGAHPNLLSVVSSLEKKGSRLDYQLSIFNSDSVFARHSLCSILLTATLVFKIFGLIYKVEFKQPNLSIKISNLHKQTKPLFLTTSQVAKQSIQNMNKKDAKK